jgi:outer membrane protein assembly factor BamB
LVKTRLLAKRSFGENGPNSIGERNEWRSDLVRRFFFVLLACLLFGGCRPDGGGGSEPGAADNDGITNPAATGSDVVENVDSPSAGDPTPSDDQPLVDHAASSAGPAASIRPTPPDVPAVVARPTAPLGEEEPQLAGKPLSHWTDQAPQDEPKDQRVETVAALTLGITHEQLWVRVAAADALAMVGPDAVPAADALIDNFEHDDPWIRTSSMNAITSMGAAVVPKLTDSFTTGTGRRRFLSALALGSIGPPAQSALPVLEEAVLVETGALHDTLVTVIAKIKAKSAGTASLGNTRPPTAMPETPGDDVLKVTYETTDWPQFHGPKRDAKCAETGLLDEWPDEGPPLLWILEGVGKGYSSISIAGDTIYTMGDLPGEEGEDGGQFVMAFELETRNPRWMAHVGPPHDDGPRCTPTVDGDHVYALGTEGELVCVSAADGEVKWQKNLVHDFDGQMMSGWKYSESPLVDGDRVVCTPGGEQTVMVALDKTTGDEIWRCALPELGERGKDGAGYSSIVAAEIAGVKQYVQMIGRGVIGVDAETGRFLWGYNPIANTVANIPMPVVRGDYVFCTTSYKTGSALLHIMREGDDFRAEETYFLSPKEFENHHGGVILLGDYLYGGNGQNKGGPTCLNFATGQIAWKPRQAPAYGSAAVLYADGHFIFRYDRGPVALIEATPTQYRLKSVFTPAQGSGPAWAHPVIHAGKLYLRHDALLLCYDLRQPE